jgi:hypothetical protein
MMIVIGILIFVGLMANAFCMLLRWRQERIDRKPVVHNVWVDGKPVPYAITEGGPAWYSHKTTNRTVNKT